MSRFQNTLLAVLVAGIVVQVWIRAGRVSTGEYRSSLTEPLAVGDTVPLLTGYNAAGAPVTVYLDDDGMRGTVLYSFHPCLCPQPHLGSGVGPPLRPGSGVR